jgi:hypothetical protein
MKKYRKEVSKSQIVKVWFKEGHPICLVKENGNELPSNAMVKLAEYVGDESYPSAWYEKNGFVQKEHECNYTIYEGFARKCEATGGKNSSFGYVAFEKKLKEMGIDYIFEQHSRQTATIHIRIKSLEMAEKTDSIRTSLEKRWIF